MAIARWDPFQEMFPLREAMNRLLAASLVRPEGLFGGTLPVALDAYAEGDHYIIEVAVPGLAPDAMNVSVQGNQVMISGEYPAAPEGRQYLLRERASGRFERTIALPTEVDADQARAQYEHGLVRLTLPKAEHAKPKRIALSAGR